MKIYLLSQASSHTRTVDVFWVRDIFIIGTVLLGGKGKE